MTVLSVELKGKGGSPPFVELENRLVIQYRNAHIEFISKQDIGLLY